MAVSSPSLALLMWAPSRATQVEQRWMERGAQPQWP